jgi:hypothetical protein
VTAILNQGKKSNNVFEPFLLGQNGDLFTSGVKEYSHKRTE